MRASGVAAGAPGGWRTAAPGAGLVLLTLAAYGPALGAGFVWDDNAHVTRTELQSWHGLWRIWFDLGSTQQYYPILHGSFWLEHRLWGDAPLGYHLVNVLLHAAAACLFAAVLRRLAVPGAWFGALLFALHPVAVESVAWISEQKNTLSTVFYLAAVLAYLPFDARRARGEKGGWSAYAGATVLFVLALLSKTVTATLPAALLVVAWWRRGRLTWRGEILPLIPWFGLGAAAGLFSAWVERVYVGAQGAGFTLNAIERCLLAGRAAWFYLGKLLWPVGLTFIYPRWHIDASAAWQYLFPLAAAGALAVAWALRRWTRAPLATGLYFLGSLFPTLGFLNVFAFLYSYVTDHWQYLASLGIWAGLAGAWGTWANAAAGSGAPPASRALPRLAAAAVLLVLGLLTWRQCRIYHDPETFYRRTLAQNDQDWMGHNNLGTILLGRGEAAAAVAEFERARAWAPDMAEIAYNLGGALAQLNRGDEAVAAYESALRLHPDYPSAEANLGQTLVSLGRFGAAIPHLETALRRRPGDPDLLAALGLALAHTGHLPEAVAQYQRALRERPDFPEAHNNLGSALAGEGQLEAAISEYTEAVRLRPDYAEAQFNLATALGNAGRLPEAIAHYRAVLRLQPGNADAEANLGLGLVQLGQVAPAIDHLQAALRLRPRYAAAHAFLGFAYAQSRRWPEAVREYRAALALNPRDGDTHYQLGVALRAVGEPAAAAAEFDTARQLSGN